MNILLHRLDILSNGYFMSLNVSKLLVITVTALVALVLFGRQTAVLQAQNSVEGGTYFAYLPMTPRADCTRYIEENNLLVMEVEHAPAVEQWAVETSLPGFTGDSYYTWLGPDYFGDPGNAILTYDFLINNPGEFNLRLHNRHDYPDPTEENDVWAKMDNGIWIKVFSPVAGQWTWGTYFDFTVNQTNASYLLSPGEHTLQIAARSFGMSIDRIHFHKNPADENTSLPVSDCI
jgi:hypothetical protein